MKLTIQTLKNTAQVIEVDEEKDTFDVLRKKIIEAFKYPEGSGIVLIHQTKIITKTDAPIQSVPAIKDGDRIIAMKKAAPAAASTSSSQSASTQQATSAQPASANPTPSEVNSAAPVSAPQPSPAAASSVAANEGEATGAVSNQLVVGDRAEEMISNIVAMGFERSQVEAAMAAAFNNPDRAVEYLTNGIPATPSNMPSSMAAEPPSSPVVFGEESMNREDGGAAGNVSDFISQFRELVRTNPSMVPLVLQSLGQQNPELLQLIQQNPDQFLAMLSDESARNGNPDMANNPTAANLLGESLAAAGSAGPAASGQSNGGGQGQPQYVNISLTEEEMSAVNRLIEMGFPRNAVLQAYIACERDENLAANFLFDQSNDFNNA